MWCKDNHRNALGDQVFNVGPFLGRITLAEENLDFDAQLIKSILEARLILDPARFLSGWQDNAYRAFPDVCWFFCRFFYGLLGRGRLFWPGG